MAKPIPLTADDLTSTKKPPAAASRQRGEVPTEELVPMQFRMPPEFARAFRVEATKHNMKYNAFLNACFAEFMKSSKS